MIGKPIRKGPRVRQIHNLQIHDCPDVPKDQRFQVYTPNGRMLEEFSTMDVAEEWCEEMFDFV